MFVCACVQSAGLNHTDGQTVETNDEFPSGIYLESRQHPGFLGYKHTDGRASSRVISALDASRFFVSAAVQFLEALSHMFACQTSREEETLCPRLSPR